MLCGGWIRGACAAVYIISERTLSFTVFCTPSRSCHSLLNDTHCSRAELIVRFPCPQRTLLAIAISVEVLCESMNLFHLEVHTITVETFTNGCWARKLQQRRVVVMPLVNLSTSCHDPVAGCRNLVAATYTNLRTQRPLSLARCHWESVRMTFPTTSPLFLGSSLTTVVQSACRHI